MTEFVTDEDFEDSLKKAEAYADASWDESDELSFMALRSAVYQLIACFKIQHIQSLESKAIEEVG